MTVTSIRRGFTLIELLIVFLIVGLLLGIVVGAATRVRDVSEVSTTEATLRKLASALDVQWKAALEMARSEWDTLDTNRKNSLKGLANNDDRRAKAIYTKFVLKREFPCSFYQAVLPDPGPLKIVTKVQQYAILVNQVHPGGETAILNATPQAPRGEESIILLYSALKRSRKGIPSINLEESIDSNFVRESKDYPGKPVRVLVDVWGTPLRFCNFPYYMEELSQAPYSATDSHDPENTIYRNTPTLWASSASAGQLFITPTNYNPNGSSIHPLISSFGPRNMIPTIASAGKDGNWGDMIETDFSGPPYPPIDRPWTVQEAAALRDSRLYMLLGNDYVQKHASQIPIPVNLQNRLRTDADDNLYSFRVRQSGGGSR